MIRDKRFDAIKVFQKIEMPHRAPHFAVSHGLKSGLLLSGDGLPDRVILYTRQFMRTYLCSLPLCTCLLKLRRPEETTYMIRPKGRSNSAHPSDQKLSFNPSWMFRG